MNEQNIKYSNRYHTISFSEDVSDIPHYAGEGQHGIFM